MLLSEAKPYIRFAQRVGYTVARTPSITQDCRLLYILEGNGSLRVGGRLQRIEAGLVVLFQGGEEYELYPAPHFDAITIDFDFTEDYKNETAVFPPISIGDTGQQTAHAHVTFEDAPLFDVPVIFEKMFSLSPAIEQIAEEYKLKKLLYREKCSGLFLGVLIELERRFLSPGKRAVTFERLIGYIHKNYSKPITNENIAKELSYDACYLNRVMLASTGLSLHQYVIQYRVNMAIKLLLSTSLTVEDVALQCGFYGTAHLSNACKKLTGNRPSDYRGDE